MTEKKKFNCWGFTNTGSITEGPAFILEILHRHEALRGVNSPFIVRVFENSKHLPAGGADVMTVRVSAYLKEKQEPYWVPKVSGETTVVSRDIEQAAIITKAKLNAINLAEHLAIICNKYAGNRNPFVYTRPFHVQNRLSAKIFTDFGVIER